MLLSPELSPLELGSVSAQSGIALFEIAQCGRHGDAVRLPRFLLLVVMELWLHGLIAMCLYAPNFFFRGLGKIRSEPLSHVCPPVTSAARHLGKTAICKCYFSIIPMTKQDLSRGAGSFPVNSEGVVSDISPAPVATSSANSANTTNTTKASATVPDAPDAPAATAVNTAAPAAPKADAQILAQPQPQAQVAEQVTTTDKVAWITVLMLGMLAAFGPVCTDIYLPAIPFITEQMHSDAAAMQLSLTTSLLGLALGQLVIGPISDTYGRKKPLYISLVLFVISSVCCAISVNVPELVTARFFQGLAGAGGVVLSRTIACDMYTGSQLTKFMALLMTVNGFAPILGPLIGSSIITFFPWQVLFIFLAVWGVMLILGSLKGVHETLPVAQRTPRFSASVKDMLHQLVNLRFLLLALSMAFVMGGFFSYLSASPFVFQKIFGLSPLGYAIVFATNAIVVAVFANIAGRVAQKISEKIIVKVALVVQFLVSILLALMIATDLNSMLVVAAILCIFVGMMGVAQTAGFGLVMGARSGGAGSASGIFGVLTFLFGAMFSPLVGLMGEQSMVPLVVCMLGSCVAAYICFVIGLRIKTQHDVEVNLQAPEGHAGDTTSRPVFHKQQPQEQQEQQH